MQGTNMFLAIIVASIICTALGLPPAPVLVFGAFAMCAAAYQLTRDIRVQWFALALAMIGAGKLLPTPSPQQEHGVDLPYWVNFISSDLVLGIAAAVVLTSAAAIGIFGRTFGIPLTPKDVIKMVKDAEEKDHDTF
jgi:hypothetical protein